MYIIALQGVIQNKCPPWAGGRSVEGVLAISLKFGHLGLSIVPWNRKNVEVESVEGERKGGSKNLKNRNSRRIFILNDPYRKSLHFFHADLWKFHLFFGDWCSTRSLLVSLHKCFDNIPHTRSATFWTLALQAFGLFDFLLFSPCNRCMQCDTVLIVKFPQSTPSSSRRSMLILFCWHSVIIGGDTPPKTCHHLLGAAC